MCHRVHGFDRSGELADAIARNTATVVRHRGRITGYATEIGLFAHAVGESNEDLKALIGAAAAFTGPGFLVPTRNHDVWRSGSSCGAPAPQGVQSIRRPRLFLVSANWVTSAYILNPNSMNSGRFYPPCIYLTLVSPTTKK